MHTNKEEAKIRIFYYDAIKVFAIFLVCVYHYNNFDLDILTNTNVAAYVHYCFFGISSMAVPLFFMVNGALLLNRSYELKTHLKKTLYLYILVAVWSAISLIIFMIINGASYSLTDFVSAWYHFKDGENNHLWFLQALISVYLLFPFVKLIYDIPQRKLLMLFCFLIFVFSFGNAFLNSVLNLFGFIFGLDIFKNVSIDLFPVINPFGNYYYAFIYFIVGGILAEKVRGNTITVSLAVLVASFLISLGALFLHGVLMTNLSHAFYDTVWNGYSSVMTLIMASSTFLFLSKLKYCNKRINHYLTVIGSNTLGIYLVHRFLGAVTFSYFQNLNFSMNLAANILYGFLLVLASLVVVIVVKRLPVLRRTVDI